MPMVDVMVGGGANVCVEVVMVLPLDFLEALVLRLLAGREPEVERGIIDPVFLPMPPFRYGVPERLIFMLVLVARPITSHKNK